MDEEDSNNDDEEEEDSEDEPQLSEPLSLSQQSEALRARHERLRAAMRKQENVLPTPQSPVREVPNPSRPTPITPFKISNLPIGVLTLMLAVTLTVYQFATRAGGGRNRSNDTDPLFDKLIGDRLDLTVSSGSGLASEDAAQDWGMIRSLLQNHATVDPRATEPIQSQGGVGGGSGNGKRVHRMSQLDGRRPLGSGPAPPFTEGAIEIADSRVGFGGGQRILFLIARRGWLQSKRNDDNQCGNLCHSHLTTPLVIATIEEKGVRGGGPFQQTSQSSKNIESATTVTPTQIDDNNSTSASVSSDLGGQDDRESLEKELHSSKSSSHPTMSVRPRGRTSTRHSPRKSILSLFSKIFKSHDDGDKGAYRAGGGGKRGERERGKAARAFNAQQRGPGLAARERPDFEPSLLLRFHAHIVSVTCKLTNTSVDGDSTENLMPDCPIDQGVDILDLGPLSLEENRGNEKLGGIPLWLSKLKGVFSDIQRLKMAILMGPDGAMISHFHSQEKKSESVNENSDNEKASPIKETSTESTSSPTSVPTNTEEVEL